MKNSRIVKAYDSINPTQAQKQRMLDAILADAYPAKTTGTAKKERPVYTARPTTTSRRSFIAPLAAGLALFVIAGFAFARLLDRSPEEFVYVEPTKDCSESVLLEQTAADHYAPVLEKYRRAISDGWSKEQCEIEGISPRVQAGYNLTEWGYACLDLDGDGREELIIAENSTDRTDNIWDLYTTLEDGTPIQLWVDEQDGGQCKLHEGNIVSISDSYKDELELTFYDLQAGQLVMREMLQWEDEDTVFHTDAHGNTRQVSSREGQEIGYSYENLKLDLHPLAEDPESLPDPDALERYAPVLEKYRTALLENWDKDKCFENDISPDISTPSSGIGWCLMDVDSNGIQELIISDGDSIFDLYTLRDNQPEHVLTSLDKNKFKLCQNGILQEQVFFAQGTSWYFHRLDDGKQELQGVLVYDSQKEYDKAYAYGPTEDDLTYISKEKAGEFITAHQPAKIRVTPLVDRNDYEAEEQSAYDDLLQLYRQALDEKWDMQLCSDNDISLMISYFAEDPSRISAHPLDLDGDGVVELIITDGMMIYDLYTQKNGTPVKLLTGWERNSYQLCLDNIIYNRGSNGAASSVNNYYQLQDGELVLVESVVLDANKDFDNPWFRSSDGETPEEPLTEAEANAIMDSYPTISFLGIDLLEIQ